MTPHLSNPELRKAAEPCICVAAGGELTELLLLEFPEAYFNEEHQEWRIDWDEKQFPQQGQRLDNFATVHDLEILHRY